MYFTVFAERKKNNRITAFFFVTMISFVHNSTKPGKKKVNKLRNVGHSLSTNKSFLRIQRWK